MRLDGSLSRSLPKCLAACMPMSGSDKGRKHNSTCTDSSSLPDEHPLHPNPIDKNGQVAIPGPPWRSKPQSLCEPATNLYIFRWGRVSSFKRRNWQQCCHEVGRCL